MEKETEKKIANYVTLSLITLITLSIFFHLNNIKSIRLLVIVLSSLYAQFMTDKTMKKILGILLTLIFLIGLWLGKI